MGNLRPPAELKNCNFENPSLLLRLIAQYLGSDRRRLLSPCVTNGSLHPHNASLQWSLETTVIVISRVHCVSSTVQHHL